MGGGGGCFGCVQAKNILFANSCRNSTHLSEGRGGIVDIYSTFGTYERRRLFAFWVGVGGGCGALFPSSACPLRNTVEAVTFLFEHHDSSDVRKTSLGGGRAWSKIIGIYCTSALFISEMYCFLGWGGVQWALFPSSSAPCATALTSETKVLPESCVAKTPRLFRNQHAFHSGGRQTLRVISGLYVW